MTNPMRRTLLAALAVGVLTAADGNAGAAWEIGWPALTGPTGNQLPMRTATPLVADLADARLAWVTATADLGASKTGSQTFAGSEDVERRIGPDAAVPPGNWAGVVVAGGRVFASSWWPAGPVFTAPYKTNKHYQKGPTPEVPTRFRVDADDIVVCYDANDGRLLWKASEPGGQIRAGGKRGGTQVAPAVDGGRVFSVGSTGRVFAHDATSGKRLWQADIGPVAASLAKQREADLATAAAGTMVLPDGLDWFTSVVVADGVVVTGDFARRGQSADIGLRGLDAATGQVRWSVPACISMYATPNPWRHDGKTWILCATAAGALRLIDPQDGRVAWTVTGLGQNWSTLAPGERTVLVNVRPTTGKRVYGIWGAYRLSPTGAERAWAMADEPGNGFSTWMDTGARQTAFVRDGMALVMTEGDKGNPGRIVLLDETTGAELAARPNGGGLDRMRELVLWLGDRALVREDHSHGASHGGRHPVIAWRIGRDGLAPERTDGRLAGLDLVEFTTAYEVMNHVPLVDGRMFERTVDGRLACYDLRADPSARTLRLIMPDAVAGLPPVRLRLNATANAVRSGMAYTGDDVDAGLPGTKVRRDYTWVRCDTTALTSTGDRIAGTLSLDQVSHAWPYEITVARGTDGSMSGTWRRSVPPLAGSATAAGAVGGRVSAERAFPTPWLADSPWTRIGTNQPGTTTWVVQLDGAITLLDKPRGLTICLDHDGKVWTRAAGAAFSYSQAWHEVDARGLVLNGDRLSGTATVILNGDPWVQPDSAGKRGCAGTLRLDAVRGADGTVSGTYALTWGVAWQAEGTIIADGPATP
jgi:outer membrane protein assembly factor BamB